MPGVSAFVRATPRLQPPPRRVATSIRGSVAAASPAVDSNHRQPAPLGSNAIPVPGQFFFVRKMLETGGNHSEREMMRGCGVVSIDMMTDIRSLTADSR